MRPCLWVLPFLGMLLAGCGVYLEPVDYREEMRKLVMGISEYAARQSQPFFIVPQNGLELVTDSGEATGLIRYDYLGAIDAVGREDLLFGYEGDDLPTPADETLYMRELCDLFEANGVAVLVTDYCVTESRVDESYNTNNVYGYISFAANQRELTTIPTYPLDPYNGNLDEILSPADARNFLYLINTEEFDTKEDFIDAVSETDFDMVIMDLFHQGEQFTAAEIDALKHKSNHGRRLVLCYVSIGEAEDYRYYWDSGWERDRPSWIEAENDGWKGNYLVRYWESAWQEILYGNDGSYLRRVMDAGFDGAYLDIIDAFEYFEGL